MGYEGESATRVGTAPRPQKPSEMVRDNAERLTSRLSGFRSRLEELRERTVGPQPPTSGAGNDVRDALNVAGFIPGVGTAVERGHTELTLIEDIFTSLQEAI